MDGDMNINPESFKVNPLPENATNAIELGVLELGRKSHILTM
jgi:hypothetical protein